MNTPDNSYLRPEYPALYNAANRASIKSQSYYLNGLKAYILLSILAAISSNYLVASKIAGIIATLLFLGIMLLSIYQAYKRFDKIWYNGRAVAESVKTRTWRFIMRAEPYADNPNLLDVKNEFIRDIKEILNQNAYLGYYLSDSTIDEEAISSNMLDVRKKSYQDRLSYYLSNRVNEQRNWYFTKAASNRREGVYWFIALICSHALAIALLLIEIGYEVYSLPIETIIVIGSGILSWTQVKKYQDLATSYTLTAHEIGILKSQSTDVIDEKTLSDYVKDSENAFSREHTQWVARKDKA